MTINKSLYTQLESIEQVIMNLNNINICALEMKCQDNKPASQSYQFLDKLGEGSFGYIWKVKQISTGQIYACKLVKNTMKKERTLLQREITILQMLKGKKGFTQLITSGQDYKNTYFIMNLLGENLEQVKMKCGNFDTTIVVDQKIFPKINVYHEYLIKLQIFLNRLKIYFQKNCIFQLTHYLVQQLIYINQYFFFYSF